MKTTDTSERGLEDLIVDWVVTKNGYELGSREDYDRAHGIDIAKLGAFLKATQSRVFESCRFEEDCPTRAQFLHRLQGEIAKDGVIAVLRKGIKHGPMSIDLFYGIPSAENAKAQEQFQGNIISVTRQLCYSRDESKLSLDLVIFINGLPIATFELKNKFTKQTVEDAVQQYKRDRDPRELLFAFGRCAVHFAVDDHEVRMCTHLKGKGSWFLPFNKGYNSGAGNPPNPNGIATDYLWKEILTKEGLANILENYAQVIEEKDDKGRKKEKQIFPRYHQLDVVRKLLSQAAKDGVGKRYLIQHSAGSGKSNSIAWLAHQLVGVEKGGSSVFDSIVVVTDRRVLDRQIRDTIKRFAQVSAIVGHAEHSGDLKKFLKAGKKVIITTVQKFPFVLDAIAEEHRKSRFAIIIDEAHSSQGGRTAAKMNMALCQQEDSDDEEETIEDKINKIMESKKMLSNASYFAFTATPKNKTLEIFGEAYSDEGQIKHRPFHSYTMKQAIEEGFILDVLKHYTPVQSYYRLAKTLEGDPLFDAKRAQKKLRKFVESDKHAIRQKSEIMIDHFNEQVIGHRKIGGEARAMVITSSILRAIEYFHVFKEYLREIKSPYQAIVAFSGEHEYAGQKVTEASLNAFPSNSILDKVQEDPYRFLIVADKFQTGYDEPLLHTMYVDKPLSGIKAVQTLSRLNRAHPQKYDTFVLDFCNEADTITKAFSDYYRATILSEETDPNKLHDLQGDLDQAQVYSWAQIEDFVGKYLNGANRDRLDPILDACVALYREELDEDGQVDFKSKAKAFTRTYGFLSSILPYSNPNWEKLAIFLNFLIPKLPAPKEEDLSRGILDAIDIDSYRVEVKSTLKLSLPDQDGELGAVPTSAKGRKPEPELERLSNIIKTFNDLFGSIEWKDEDKIRRIITEEIPEKVGEDPAYQNAMKNSDKQNARIEHDKALQRVMVNLLSDQTELFKQFSDNPSFKKWLSDINFDTTYEDKGKRHGKQKRS